MGTAIQAIATDFDDSFVDGQGVATQRHTWDEVRRVRAAGVKMVMVTGRDLAYVFGPTGILHWNQVLQFDAIIGEGGAVAFFPHENRTEILCEPVSPLLIDAVKRTVLERDPAKRIDMTEAWFNQASFSFTAKGIPIVKGVLRRKNAWLKRRNIPVFNVWLIENGNSGIVLPRGVDKWSATSRVLDELGVDPAKCVGVGDGENDVVFMSRLGIAAPVQNAHPSLKALPNAIEVKGKSHYGFREICRRVRRGELDKFLPGANERELVA